MRSRLRILATSAFVLAGLGVGSVAFGLPWDVDMVDGFQVKGYEVQRVVDGKAIGMQGLPDGIVAQPNLISPKSYGFLGPDGTPQMRTPDHKQTDPEVATLAPPFPPSDKALATGEKMFKTYCTPCHGDGKTLGPLSAPGRVPAIAVLAGPDGRLQRQTDGWVYYTIKNGSVSQIMPPYGYMMTETEMWSLVHYLRTLDNGQYVPPAPPAPAPAGTP